MLAQLLFLAVPGLHVDRVRQEEHAVHLYVTMTRRSACGPLCRRRLCLLG